MGAIAEKRTVIEQVGSAMNASVLLMEESRETALERVAALGAAARCVELGADMSGIPLAGAEAQLADGRKIDRRNWIAGQIGPLLWHVKAGGQIEFVDQVIGLFVEHCMTRRVFDDIPNQDERRAWVERFASCAVHEWLSDRCHACGGTCVQERIVGRDPVRPRGRGQRNAQYVTCLICQGSGRVPASLRHGVRARTLGLARGWYFKLGWPQRFAQAHEWLEGLANRIVRPLTQELGRSKRSPAKRSRAAKRIKAVRSVP